MNNLKIIIVAFIMGVIFSTIVTNKDDTASTTSQNTTQSNNNIYFSFDDPEKMYNMNFGSKTIKVTWKTVSNPNKTCSMERKRLGATPFATEVLACSIWDDDTCTIYTAKNVSMHTGGHEMFHCLIHAYHPE